MGIVFVPDSSAGPDHPDVDPGAYPTGTVFETEDGGRWVVRWSAILGFHWSCEDHTNGSAT